MFYKNARIFTPDFRFHTGAFEVRDGLFGEVLPENVPADAVDLNGCHRHPRPDRRPQPRQLRRGLLRRRLRGTQADGRFLCQVAA